MTESEKEFMQSVDENPAAVVVATIYGPGTREISGVFSTYGKAEAWTEEHAGEGSALLVPYIIDEPGFGNEKGQ